MIEPHTAAEWAAYRALPEWEVTAKLSRTARFRMHAASPEQAAAMLAGDANGVQAMDDLYGPGGLEVEAIISTEPVSPG